MAITIDWPNGIINVPKADLTLIQVSPFEIRELDLDWFRLQLKDLEDSDDGMPFQKTHNHNTEVTIGNLTLSRVIEILDPYTVTFEDGQYAVNLVGANSNVGDKVNVNQVSIRSSNSAGLITVTSGSGVTDQDKTDIINGVWSKLLDAGYSAEQIVRLLASIAIGKTVITDLGGGLATVKFRDISDAKDRVVADMDNSERTNVTLDAD